MNTNTSGKPIYAEDVLLHSRLKLSKEDFREHPEFKKVKKNDYLIAYCTPLVPHSPNQIKFIFRVVSKIKNLFVLKTYTKLRRGYSLEHIHSLVEEGQLSKKMLHAGKQGFHICQVPFSDLELLVNYDPIVRSYHSSSWKSMT